MKIHILKLCRSASGSAVAPQTYPNSTGPNVSERDGIILADLHKSLQIWGWFLPKKNRPPHPRGGVEVGILGGQQIKSQNSGKCHELSRKSIIFFFLHIPPQGVPGRGGWGSTFKKSGKFHELSRKSIKKSPPPPPTNRGRSGNFRGSKNQKTGKCHELSRKSIKFVFLPIPPGGSGRGDLGVKISKVR